MINVTLPVGLLALGLGRAAGLLFLLLFVCNGPKIISATADPFSAPLLDSDPVEGPVRVRGIVVRIESPGAFVVDLPGRTVRVETAQTNDVTAGYLIEAAGEFVAGENPTLRDAVFRRLGFPAEKDLAAPQFETLTNFDAVRKLSAHEASQRIPVRSRGVITYFDPEWMVCFVQDGTAGIYANFAGRWFDVEQGQEVEIEGVTGPGEFAPVINEPSFTILGKTRDPVAQLSSFQELSSGQYDSQWVETRGFVRSIRVDGSHLYLNLAVRSDGFRVIVPNFSDQPAPTNLLYTTVRVIGVCGTDFNARRQLVGIHVSIPDLSHIIIESRASGNPFSLPLRAADDLLRFSAADHLDSRARLKGEVTYKESPTDFVLQDDRGGIRVRTAEPGRSTTPFTPHVGLSKR